VKEKKTEINKHANLFKLQLTHRSEIALSAGSSRIGFSHFLSEDEGRSILRNIVTFKCFEILKT
jgi:hypothetical protein